MNTVENRIIIFFAVFCIHEKKKHLKPQTSQITLDSRLEITTVRTYTIVELFKSNSFTRSVCMTSFSMIPKVETNIQVIHDTEAWLSYC